MFPKTPSIRVLIRAALAEDNSRTDVTSRTLIKPTWNVRAVIVAKQTGVVCGLPLAKMFFHEQDSRTRVRLLIKDGARVHPGTRLLAIQGKALSILAAERPALNALQHLSGIATFTSEQVRKLQGTGTKLFDTRKTLPGWRLLQKYAVRCGRGHNHRMSLGDAVLIKENHLKIARLAGSDWKKGIQAFAKKYQRVPLQMEIQTNEDLQDALLVRPQLVLLDNFPPSKLRPMMRLLRKEIRGVKIELTGGIRAENLRKLGGLGADRISMGCLTHSVTAFDCSLDILDVQA